MSKGNDSFDSLSTLIDLIPDPVIVVDSKKKIVTANKIVGKFSGVAREHLVGKSFSELDFVSEEVKLLLAKNMKKRMAGSNISPYEITLTSKSGKVIYLEVKGNRIDYKGRKLDLEIFHDITEGKNEEKRLQKDLVETEMKFQAINDSSFDAIKKLREFDERIIDSLGDAVLVIDPQDFSILNANKAALEQLKIERKDIIGKKCYEATHFKSAPCSDPDHVCPIREMLETGKTAISEHTHVDQLHKEFFVEVFVYPLKNTEGKNVVIHVSKDITQKKLMERSLQASEEKFRAIATSVRDAIILVDNEAKVTYWNPAAEKTFGYSCSEAIGKNIHQLVVPTTMCREGKERIDASVKIFSETGSGYFTVGRVQLIGKCKDGSEFPAELSLCPIQLAGEWNAVGLVKDVSKRKRSEEMLKEAEQRYHALFDQAPIGVLIVEPENASFVEFNDFAHLQLNYTRDEFAKLSIPDIEAKETKSEVKLHLSEMMELGGEEFETLHRTKDGDVRNVLVNTRAIKLAGRKLLHCIFRDITEIKNVEKALMDSETQYRQLVELAQEGVWALDRDFVTTYVNARMANMLGYVKSEMVGQSLFDFIDKRVLDSAKKYLSKYENGVSGNFEYTFIRKDGSRIFSSIAASQITDDQGNCLGTLALVADISARKEMEKKLENYSKHLEDTVEKKTRQLADAQAQIIKSERLAAIGELAGMVGHDLRNPLTGIKNASYYLKRKETESLSPQSKEMLEIITTCVDRSNKIINDLLDYSREIRLERKEISLNNLVSGSVAMVQFPKTVKVEKNFPENLVVNVDVDRFERVFINLFKNAIDAMPNGGLISVVCREANDSLELAVSDTGLGIPDEVLPKLFAPLSTSKAQGMGFGLAICKRIIEAHGGTISVKTAKGKGTSFTIMLPIDHKDKLEVKVLE